MPRRTVTARGSLGGAPAERALSRKLAGRRLRAGAASEIFGAAYASREKDTALAEKDAELAKEKATVAEKDAELASLREMIAERQRWRAQSPKAGAVRDPTGTA